MLGLTGPFVVTKKKGEILQVSLDSRHILVSQKRTCMFFRVPEHHEKAETDSCFEERCAHVFL